MANPSLMERTILQSALEAVAYGTEGATYKAVPVFDVGPLVEPRINFIRVNRAKDSLGQDGFCSAEASNRFTFKTYTFGNGTATPPDWMSQFLPACGFLQATMSGAAPSMATYTAVDGAAGAIPVGTYKYTATKVVVATGVETAADVTTGITLLAAGSKKALVTLAAAGSGNAWRLYRTKVAGALAAAYFLADLPATDTTYVDNALDSELDQTRVAPAAAASTVWIPRNSPILPASVTLKGYLDSHFRRALGCIGNFSTSVAAGQLEENTFEMEGLYEDANNQADNSAASPGAPANPGCAPSAQSLGFYLVPRDTATTATAGTSITPMVVKRITMTPGAQVNPRTDANAANAGLLGYEMTQQFQGELTVVIEVDKNFAWDPVEDAKANVAYGCGYTMGPATSYRRLERTFPRLQQSQAPTMVAENGNIRCWSLRFALTDLNGFGGATDTSDWVRLRYF